MFKKWFVLLLVGLLVGCSLGKSEGTKEKDSLVYFDLKEEGKIGDEIISNIELQTIPLNRDKVSDGYKFYYNKDGLSIEMFVYDIKYIDDIEKIKNNMKYLHYKEGYSLDKIKTDTLTFSDVVGTSAYVYDSKDNKDILKYNIYLTNGVFSKIVIECEKGLATKEEMRLLVLGDLVKVLKSIEWSLDNSNG